jgi:alkylation response protein AidB-like acyl-CoA dehydrogenase
MMHELGPSFAKRSVQCDANDRFPVENFSELKARGVLAAGIPAELGGGSASYPELCEMLRAFGRYCGSTALTLSMHTHSLATIVWRWRRDPARFDNFLRRAVEQRL